MRYADTPIGKAFVKASTPTPPPPSNESTQTIPLRGVVSEEDVIDRKYKIIQVGNNDEIEAYVIYNIPENKVKVTMQRINTANGKRTPGAKADTPFENIDINNDKFTSNLGKAITKLVRYPSERKLPSEKEKKIFGDVIKWVYQQVQDFQKNTEVI